MPDRWPLKRVALWAALAALAHLLLYPVVVVVAMGFAFAGPNDPNRRAKHTAGEALVVAYFLPVIAAESAGLTVRKGADIRALLSTVGWCALVTPLIAAWRWRRWKRPANST